MKKTRILGTGLTGLVGSRIVELLQDEYEFENLSLETGIDITNKDQVEKIVIDSPARVVLHLAAKADVDGCEKDKPLGENGDAWAVNVEGTRNIVEACQKSGKKIIYISTDFVFDGKKDSYTEEDKPSPVNWYGLTKFEAERIIIDSGLPYLILRLAFPYRANFEMKKDLVKGIIEKLKNGQKVIMVSDQVITPTFIDDIASGLDFLIKNGKEGIYHLVGSSSHSPFEIATLIAKTFSLNSSLIQKISANEYFKDRAPRPFSLVLKNDKLKKLGIKMLTFQEGLLKVKNQLISPVEL